MTNDELTKTCLRLIGSTIRLHAKCDALEFALMGIAGHVGVDPMKLSETIEKLTEQRHQERLQDIENKNPAMAAAVDIRPLGHDITGLF
jgi:hypothetical protein